MINVPVSRKSQPHLPLLLLLVLVLPSCAVPPPVPRHPAPAPMDRPQPPPPVARPDAPVPDQSPLSVPSGPASSLYVKASKALAAGHADKAEMLIERALRIEPRNALLWHLLGQSKYAQGDFAQTVEFCRKSESLAGNNTKLREYNRSLLQKAYRKLGDTEQAEKLGR